MIGLDIFIPANLGQDLGNIFGSIMQPLYWAASGILTLFHTIVSPVLGANSGWTWLVVIVMLTIVVRLAMLPLYVKQLNSSRAMQVLQPKIKALQQKYGADRERLGQESMKLYREEGVNPMASCLPLLIQLPILWALFIVLNGAARGIPRGYWFESNPQLVDSLSGANILGAKLSSTVLPFTNGFGATQILGLILIFSMVGVLFWQQMHMMRRNMPPSALEGPMGQQQKYILYLMPFMYFISGPVIPIGVLLYWFTSNVWTMGQQYLIIRTYPTPGTPAYLEWEDRMRARGKDPVAIERARSDKARRRPRPVATQPVVDSNGKATVSRQTGVSRRTTVRKDAGSGTAGASRQQVARQQVSRQSRAARKKK